jgi:hypothetical protein
LLGGYYSLEKLLNWKPSSQWTPEDRLLYAYWQAVGGVIYTEVVIGGQRKANSWPSGSKPRRIDGVRILLPEVLNADSDIITYSWKNADEFEHKIQEYVVEVIEVKTRLGRYVIGQAIIGVDLLELASQPKQVHSVVVCKIGDPLMELLCQKRNVKVWISS